MVAQRGALIKTWSTGGWHIAQYTLDALKMWCLVAILCVGTCLEECSCGESRRNQMCMYKLHPHLEGASQQEASKRVTQPPQSEMRDEMRFPSLWPKDDP